MADTIRNEAALQTLLADNTAGDISAQDVRDLLVSVPSLAIYAGNASAQRTALGLGTMATAAAADYLALAGGTMSGTLNFASANLVRWNSEIALGRNSATAAEFNNGTLGTFRDVVVRNIQIGSTSQGFNTVGTYAMQAIVASNKRWQFDSTAFRGVSTQALGWTSSSTDPDTASDVALYRNAAGVVEINNGTAGTYRDLILRTLTISGGSVTGPTDANNYSTATTVIGNARIGEVVCVGNAVKMAWNMSSDRGIVVGTGNGYNFSSLASDTSTQTFINNVDTGIKRNAAGVVEINSGTAGTYRDLRARNVRTEPVAVASLVAAATAGKGARAFVTDANAATFGTTVAAGGANNVPVYSDGTNWIIG